MRLISVLPALACVAGCGTPPQRDTGEVRRRLLAEKEPVSRVPAPDTLFGRDVKELDWRQAVLSLTTVEILTGPAGWKAPVN
jgi:hypothetical protein